MRRLAGDGSAQDRRVLRFQRHRQIHRERGHELAPADERREIGEGVGELELQISPGLLHGVGVGQALGAPEQNGQKRPHPGTGLRGGEEDVGVEEDPHRLSR